MCEDLGQNAMGRFVLLRKYERRLKSSNDQIAEVWNIKTMKGFTLNSHADNMHSGNKAGTEIVIHKKWAFCNGFYLLKDQHLSQGSITGSLFIA